MGDAARGELEEILQYYSTQAEWNASEMPAEPEIEPSPRGRSVQVPKREPPSHSAKDAADADWGQNVAARAGHDDKWNATADESADACEDWGAPVEADDNDWGETFAPAAEEDVDWGAQEDTEIAPAEVEEDAQQTSSNAGLYTKNIP